MTTIQDLIEKAGGPPRIAEESKATDAPISPYAVQKWRHRGIPDTHWDLVMRLAGVSLRTVYEANRAMRGRAA